MTGRRFVLFLARSAIVALAVGLSFAGCSRQAEGERCDLDAAGHTDCEEGLRCIACGQLRSGVVDRCCPRNAGEETDARCQRADTERTCGAAAGGTSGTGGSGTSGGSGGRSGGSGGQSGSSATGGQGGSAATSGEGGAPDTAGAGGVP
jgi:hypothetical protein